MTEAQLTGTCDAEDLPFETTEDLQSLEGIIGQKRGADALTFGLKIKKRGYNIYVAGTSGVGKTTIPVRLRNSSPLNCPYLMIGYMYIILKIVTGRRPYAWSPVWAGTLKTT